MGLAVGPVFYLYLIPRVGGPSCILWGTIIALGCSVWSALVTGPHDYVAYALSRWVGGMFGSAGTVVGGGTILELFFLHQRGWAFAVFGVCTWHL